LLPRRDSNLQPAD